MGDIKNIFLLVLDLPNEVNMSYFFFFFGSIAASLYNLYIYLFSSHAAVSLKAWEAFFFFGSHLK